MVVEFIDLPGTAGASRAYEVSFRAVPTDDEQPVEIYLHAAKTDDPKNAGSIAFVLLNGWLGTSHAYTVSGQSFRCLTNGAGKSDAACPDEVGLTPSGATVKLLVDDTKVTVLLDDRHLGSFNAPKAKTATVAAVRYNADTVDVSDKRADAKTLGFAKDYALNNAVSPTTPSAPNLDPDDDDGGWSLTTVLGLLLLAAGVGVAIWALVAKNGSKKKKKASGGGAAAASASAEPADVGAVDFV